VAVFLSACSSHAGVNDGCFGGVAVADIGIELPGGMSSVSSVEVSGACEMLPYGCLPACDGGGCACEISAHVTENGYTANADPAPVCHVRATSVTGQVFTKDVSFVLVTGAGCPVLNPPTAEVIVDFGGASAPDASADSGD
jgi:hypothetical protein